MSKLTFGQLESLNKKVYGFLIVPFLLTFIKIKISANQQTLTKFHKEFFSLLIKQSVLKFNLYITMTIFLLTLMQKEVWLLCILMTFVSMATSSIITLSLKNNIKYIQNEEKLNSYSGKFIMTF